MNSDFQTRARCLLLDFDGTIADSLHHALSIYNRLAGKYKMRPLEEADVLRAREMTPSQFRRFIGLRRLKIPLAIAEGKAILRREIDQLPVIDGLPEVLPELRQRYPILGILTSNSQENVECFLQDKGLPHFDFIESVTRLGHKHKSIRRLLKVHDLQPWEVVMVGDETRDIAACRKVGADSVGVTWGFNSEQALRHAGAQAIVHEPPDLLKTLVGPTD